MVTSTPDSKFLCSLEFFLLFWYLLIIQIQKAHLYGLYDSMVP